MYARVCVYVCMNICMMSVVFTATKSSFVDDCVGVYISTSIHGSRLGMYCIVLHYVLSYYIFVYIPTSTAD